MDAKENLNFNSNLSKKINDAEIKEMKYKGNIFLKLFKSKNYGRFFCKIIISLAFFSSGWFCFFVNSKESNPKDMLLVESEDEEEVSNLMGYYGNSKNNKGSVKKPKKGVNKGRKRKIKKSMKNAPVLLNKTKNSKKKDGAENKKIKQKVPLKTSSKKSKKLVNENFSKNKKKNLKESKQKKKTKPRKTNKIPKKNKDENYNINNEKTFEKKPKKTKFKKQKKPRIKKTFKEKAAKKLGTKRKKVSPRKNKTASNLKNLLCEFKRKKHLKLPKKLNKIKDFPKEKSERIKRLVEVLKNIFARKKVLRREEFLKKIGEVSLDFALKKPCNLSFNSNDGEDDFNNDSVSCLNENFESFNRFEDFKEEPKFPFENNKKVNLLVEVLKNIFARKKVLRREEFLKKFGEVSLDFALKKPCNLSFNSNDGEDDFNNDSVSCLNENFESFNRFEDFEEEPNLPFENNKMVVFKNGLNFEFNYDFNGDWLKLINPKNGRNFFVKVDKEILNKLFEKKKAGELNIGDGTISKNNYLSKSYDPVNLKYEIDENALNIENCNSGFKLSFNLNGEAKKAIEKFFSQDSVEDELFEEENFESLNHIENEKKLELISDEKKEEIEKIIEEEDEELQSDDEKEKLTNLTEEKKEVLNSKSCNSKNNEEMLNNLKNSLFSKALLFIVQFV